MKPSQLITSLICFALWETGLQAATKYWDINGATPGAGGANPSGTWNTVNANWTTSSTGTSAATTWASGDDAVFSAGTDATGDFTNTLDATASPPVQNVGNLTVEEGALTIEGAVGSYLNLGGGVAGKGIIDIAPGLNATISAEFDSVYGAFGDDNGQMTKIGTGTLTLSGPNLHGGTNVVLQGVLVVAADTALGLSFAPTIVSNGAAVHLSGARNLAEPFILNGNGVGNTGVLRGSTNNSATGGGVILGSDARIEANGARLDFNVRNIEGTNGGIFNLTIGGDGGRIRCNNAGSAPYDVPINLGNGILTKEGTTLLQLENTNTCSAFYFNGGDIYPRNDAGWAGFGQGPAIFVGAGAGNFRASFQDVYIGYGLSLASGANLGFDCAASWTLYVDGLIGGAGGIAKRNTGFLMLTNYHNIFTGNTTIENGTLIVAPNSSISNTTVIDIWTNGTLDVSALGGGFVLQAAQTLKGNGTVLGNVTANGIIAPGSSVGSLTNIGNLTLKGNLLIEVDKSLSPGASNDLITVTGSLSHGGGSTLTVVNLGTALAIGDSFQVFTGSVTSGQTIAVSGGGATWTNRLAVDGSIAVVALAPPAVPATNLTITAVGLNSIGLGGKGAANTAYDVYAYTNVTTPMSSWWKIGTTNSSAGGAIQFVDPQATNQYRFYRFGQPSP